MTIQVVILAAGQGKRMASHYPKVLHSLGGKALLCHVIDTAAQITKTPPLIVYGHEGQQLLDHCADVHAEWVQQTEQLGTGHALLQALKKMPSVAQVLVLYGDVPLISVETLQRLIKKTPPNAIGMLTATLPNPSGYGRIKRDKSGNIIGVVEEKDANKVERALTEINPGIYLIPKVSLDKWLPNLKNNNAQAEYYLTDIISMAVAEQLPIVSVEPEQIEEILGVNDRMQLAHLERFYQRNLAESWLQKGVTMMDPNRVDIRGNVQLGRDVIIDINVILEGEVVIGDGCYIGPNSILQNTTLAHHVIVKANSLIEAATIGPHSIIGPFARIRPGTHLEAEVHIGNFVEIKKSKIGAKSKINHLSYVGDAEIGSGVNIGAGTITCNYDGANKHKTIIGDNVHIGSDTQLVAPVTIGSGATIGAGSTIIKDAPPGELTLTQRVEQRSTKDWKRAVKEKS